MLHFGLPKISYVELFVVPARLTGDKNNDIASTAGAVVAAPKRVATIGILLGVRQAGLYSVMLSGRDLNGNLLPSGFYRIYLHVGDVILWHDVLLAWEMTDLPTGLRRNG